MFEPSGGAKLKEKMTRQSLLNQIEKNEKKIIQLRKKIVELKIQELKFSDKKQQYKEGIEIVGGKEVLRGRIFFKESWIDEDSKEVVEIERKQIVMENNKWIL